MKKLSKTAALNFFNEESERFVVLVSENLTGHRVHYLKALSEEMRTENCTILLASDSKIDFDLDPSQISMLREIDFLYIDDFGAKSKTIDFVKIISKQCGKPKILFWDADNWISHLLFFKDKARLLFMRPYLTSNRIDNILKYTVKWIAIFYFHLIRKFEVGVLGVPFHAPKLFPSLWFDDPVLIKPGGAEYAEDSLSFIESLIFDLKSRIILVPGFLTSRKNPKLAIEILNRVMTYSGESVCLVFAGKADETSRKEIIKTENPRVVHIDRYLTEAEYRVLLNISTVVLLPYSNRGSSGVVLESLAHGKNVIITKSRIWMNAKNYCSGLLHVVPLDVVQVSKEVQSILQSKQIEKSIILSGVARSNVIQFLAKDDIEVK